MLGAIIGDIVGSIYERNPIKTKNFEFWGAGCTFTDDTVMTLAVADAILEHLRGTGDFKEILVSKCRSSAENIRLPVMAKVLQIGYIPNVRSRITASVTALQCVCRLVRGSLTIWEVLFNMQKCRRK